MPYQELGPFILTTLSTSQRLALTQFPGLTVRDGNLGMIMVSDGFTWSGYITKTQLPDMFDCVIDDGYQGVLDTVYPTIAEALADTPNGRVSIFVRSAGDIDPVTIASTDSVQRIQGKDADTTELPVNVTCNKDDVTFEQLKIPSGVTLGGVGGGGGGEIIIDNCLFRDGGRCTASAGDGVRITGCRFVANTSTIPLTARNYTRITNSRFGTASANHLLLTSGAVNIVGIIIGDCRFSEPATACIVTDTGKYLQAPVITSNVFSISDSSKYGLDISVINGVISHNAINAGRVRLTSPAGENIDTIFGFNYMGGHFSCISADADAAGLKLIGNTFLPGSTILGSQDAVWLGNDMVGCTINFQSKTGIVVLGGDMTGATLQNIPSDIVFRNVKGQDDRGTYTGGTWAAALLAATDNTYDIGATGATRFRDLFLAGAWKEGTVGMALLPDGNGTRDLGASGTRWKDVWAGGAANFSAHVASGGLRAITDATYDIGLNSTALRFRDLFLSRNAGIGGTLTAVGNVDFNASAIRSLTGFGPILASLIQQGAYVATPSASQAIAAGTAILANAEVVQITCTGAVTSTAAPLIANGGDGQIVEIINVGSGTLTISDQGTLANSGVRLTATTIAIAPRDSIRLRYNTIIGDWVQATPFVNVI